MKAFNANLWKSRSKSRYDKLVQRNPNLAEKNRSKELKVIDCLHVVVEWCEARLLKVRFGSEGSASYNSIEQLIVVNSRARPETQLFLLLHEIGHYIIDKEGTQRHKGSKGYKDQGFKDRSLHYRIDCIDEEYEAWDKGLKLSKELNLDIDIEKFGKIKVSSLKTYFEWALSDAKQRSTREFEFD